MFGGPIINRKYTWQPMSHIEEMLKHFNKFNDVSIHHLLRGVALHLKAPKIPCCLNMA